MPAPWSSPQTRSGPGPALLQKHKLLEHLPLPAPVAQYESQYYTACFFPPPFTLFSGKKMSIHPDTYVKLKKDRNTTVRSQVTGMTPTAW